MKIGRLEIEKRSDRWEIDWLTKEYAHWIWIWRQWSYLIQHYKYIRFIKMPLIKESFPKIDWKTILTEVGNLETRN